MSNFELSSRLRLFLSIAVQGRCSFIGSKCPVSIRKRYTFSQSLVIYPESDYSFFTANEVMSFISLANDFNLDAFVETENGVAVIKISDYSING